MTLLNRTLLALLVVVCLITMTSLIPDSVPWFDRFLIFFSTGIGAEAFHRLIRKGKFKLKIQTKDVTQVECDRPCKVTMVRKGTTVFLTIQEKLRPTNLIKYYWDLSHQSEEPPKHATPEPSNDETLRPGFYMKSPCNDRN